MAALVQSAVTTKEKANNLGQLLKRNGWYNGAYSVTSIEDKLALPLTDKGCNELHKSCQIGESFIIDGITFDIKIVCLNPSKRQLVTSKTGKLLKLSQQHVFEVGASWSLELEEQVPRGWEVHGNTALLPQHTYTSNVWNQQGFWEVVASCLGVVQLARKAAIMDDDFRSPCVTFLLGNDPWVLHIDNGIKYTYDMTKSMFSSGNISEKLRVASFDCSEEVVVDLYAGVGYFSLPYLVHAGARHVHACEWNPAAVEALTRNLQLNHCAHRCTVYRGDNAKVCPQGIADRVNLGLIPSSEPGWPVACKALRAEGGILHIHANVISASRTDARCQVESNSKPCDSVDKDRDKHVSNLNSIVDNAMQGNRPDLILDKDVSKSNLEKDALDSTELNTSTVTNLTTDLKNGKDFSNSRMPFDSSVNMKNSARKQKKWMKFKKTCRVKKEWQSWSEETAATIRTLLSMAHPGQIWHTHIKHIEHVKSYAPCIDHVVLDLECKSNVLECKNARPEKE